MADAEDEIDEAEGGEETAEAEAPSKKKKIIKFAIMGLGALVVLGGAGFGAQMFGLIGGGGAEGEVAEAQKPAFYYDLPTMTVNLNSVDQRARYLKLQISLEASDQDTISKLQPQLPRLMDAFQVYLRELRSTDLDGSAGMHRLKEELTRRVNIAIYPSAIDAVLFREIIVQ